MLYASHGDTFSFFWGVWQHHYAPTREKKFLVLSVELTDHTLLYRSIIKRTVQHSIQYFETVKLAPQHSQHGGSTIHNRSLRSFISFTTPQNWTNILGFLARSANLPEGLYILPMFFLYFFIFFNGGLSSPHSSDTNGAINFSKDAAMATKSFVNVRYNTAKKTGIFCQIFPDILHLFSQSFHRMKALYVQMVNFRQVISEFPLLKRAIFAAMHPQF